jgi:hypothetical protein
MVLLRYPILYLLVALTAPIAARADSPPQPVPADGQCTVAADPSWTKQEQFVWLAVCSGKEADFNKEPDYGGDLDPMSSAGLPDSRILRPSFIETIMLKDKYRSALTRFGVRINGARFLDTVDLRNANLEHDLWLNRGLFEKGADLQGIKTTRRITFDHSKILGTFNAVRTRVEQDLSMHEAQIYADMDLSRAYVGNEIDLGGTTVAGNINLDTAEIGRALTMHKAHFEGVNLGTAHVGLLDFNGSVVTGLLNMNGIQADRDMRMEDKAAFKTINIVAARIAGSLYLKSSTINGELNLNRTSIAGQLNLIGSTVTGLLYLNDVSIGQNLHMEGKAHFAEINLVGSHIGGQFAMDASTVSGPLKGDYIDVEQTAFLRGGATFGGQVHLASAKFGQDLDLSDGIFTKDVNLSGAKIIGVLGLQKAQWLHGARLILTNGSAGGIDLSDSWPDNILLNGFTYRNLSNLAKYNSEEAATWFGKQTYSPQPYEQLATVLQNNGLIDDATDIREAGKEREYETASGLRRVWLLLLKYSIGFGYHLEYAFAWAAGFVLLGWAVLYATGQRTKHGMTLGLTYSFDMLLPLVQLNKKHDDVDLDPWPQRYFYAHKLIGVLLTSFIVAGISGLTR